MKILLQSNDLSWPGGTELQVKFLQEDIASLGFDVVANSDPNVPLGDIDVILISGLNPAANPFYENCINQKKKYFVKPVYHASMDVPLKQIARVLSHARAIICESSAEQNAIIQIGQIFNVALPPIHITLPAVNPVFSPNPAIPKKFVYNAGGYFPLRRTDLLITLCQNNNLPLIVSGPIIDSDYYQYCQSLQYGDLRGMLAQKDCNSILQQTKIYVCCSEYEVGSTCVSEAIACDVPVISTVNHYGNSNFPAPGYFIYNTDDELEQLLVQVYNDNTIVQENTYLSRQDSKIFYHNIFMQYTRPVPEPKPKSKIDLKPKSKIDAMTRAK